MNNKQDNKLTNLEFTKTISDIAKSSVNDVLDVSGLTKKNSKSVVKESTRALKDVSKTVLESAKGLISEALIAIPRAFLNKSDKLSERTKEAHETLYKSYIDSFNKVSIKLDSAIRDDANSNNCDLRSLKMDEQYNLNAIKLHELYFGNIGDLASEITYESIPYIKLSRDFGNFEKWQYDFIASCLSSREGWVITYFEPYKNVYMTAIIDSHNVGLPLGAIPVIVMDMWSHSYFKDYANDKKAYVLNMMRELNWNVIEARMVVAERTELGKLYQIIPLVNNQPEVMLGRADQAQQAAPIEPNNSSNSPTPQPASPMPIVGNVGSPIGGQQ